ncbi:MULTISPECIES: ammonia-dependent NAD(+) synthetase [Nocardiopsidaceae]|uniref:NH(3)-dependent NAD(+) synthetase n=1 Tax=Streptomonospora nanhaiensis TaxID=1323731 RepID=A0ABY6YM92_9ACTN|nr:ammonia-dependent NAD(+) synthetase [Streptomonospora nanhaiensis]WAE73351.1 ammonia-dependent NAD(+) synthetase [Streptomonospora nanhaiensis]
MTDIELSRARREIILDLDVPEDFDVRAEIERRVTFLSELLATTGATALVLGISGGVDSLTAGLLCRLAVDRAREAGHTAEYVAMRLPYGAQKDEEDAARAVDLTAPDRCLTVDVKPASDAMAASLAESGLAYTEASEDFVLGNVKARQRMIAQYAVAGGLRGLVIGTDHAAEAVTGFFTKYGDGGVDVVPLTGLTKRRVRAVAAELGAPDDLVSKVPTADLETLSPQKPDEEALGLTYDQIDDFLEGLPVPEHVETTLVDRYRATAHKRALPTAPQGR